MSHTAAARSQYPRMDRTSSAETLSGPKVSTVSLCISGCAARRDRAFTRISYGLNGAYFNETIPEHRFVNGRTVDYTQPARTRSDNEPMLFPSVGFGVRKSLGNHLAVRADADLLAFFVIPAG